MLSTPTLPLSPDGSLSSCDAIYMLLSLTRRCNMRCPGCFLLQQDEDFFQDQDVSVEFAKEIIDFYVADGIKQAVADAEGEILLHPHVQQILSHIGSRRLPRRPWLVTNGILASKHVSMLLSHAGEILVSVDGPDARSYNAFRGGNRALFEKVVQSLQALVAAKQEMQSPTEIIVNSVITADRVELMPKLIDFAQTMGVCTIKFSNFHVLGNTEKSPVRLDDPAAIQMINQIVGRRDYTVNIFLPRLFGDGSCGNVQMGQMQPPFWCKMLLSINVRSDGDFSPCCRVLPGAQWGNFSTTPEKHNSDTLRAFRRSFFAASTHKDLPDVCKECTHLSPRRLAFDARRKTWGLAQIS